MYLKKSETLIQKDTKETLMYRTVLWTLWERERVGRFGEKKKEEVRRKIFTKG